MLFHRPYRASSKKIFPFRTLSFSSSAAVDRSWQFLVSLPHVVVYACCFTNVPLQTKAWRMEVARQDKGIGKTLDQTLKTLDQIQNLPNHRSP